MEEEVFNGETVDKKAVDTINSMVAEAESLAIGGGEKTDPKLSTLAEGELKDLLKNQAKEIASEIAAKFGDVPIVVLKEVFSMAKNRHRQLTENLIPEQMLAAGLTELRTVEGHFVKITEQITASVKKDDAYKAYDALLLCLQKVSDWGSDVAKAMLDARFKKSYSIENPDESVVNVLLREGIDFTPEFSIHPATLKSLAKQLHEEGVTLPDVVHPYIYWKTTIK